jgi:hypothetical protein
LLELIEDLKLRALGGFELAQSRLGVLSQRFERTPGFVVIKQPGLRERTGRKQADKQQRSQVGHQNSPE